MTNETYRGVVRRGLIVLENESSLTEGTEVLVTPVGNSLGNAAGVLAAVQSAPHVPPEWVDELEQAIASGRRPPTLDDPFAEELVKLGWSHSGYSRQNFHKCPGPSG